jgi:(1->4)-alpha-D-glucan 1-alpha-D-glucosylmutase
VYRTYVSPRGVSDEDRRIVQWAVNVARTRSGSGELSVFDFLRDVLLCEDSVCRTDALRRAVLEFAMKFQQVTSPVAAKGVEDTAFYRYNALLALNEVGADPRRFSYSNVAIHQENLERARAWPHSMLATSTHDTKRSEDARARIAVISELPELWRHHLTRWTRVNRTKRMHLANSFAPTRNDEYLIYQSLTGIWPGKGQEQESLQTIVERLQAYVIKAAREAKRSTSWMNPDTDYENGLTQFVARLLEDPDHNAFLRDFTNFAQVTDYFGQLNSMSQTLLKLTAPGVPDVYQGMERPNFSLVDPDNRRPVDFEQAGRQLGEVESADAAAVTRLMLGDWRDGRAKLFITWRLLQLRREFAELFAHGDYEPLQVSGARKDHVLAFARKNEDTCITVVLSRWPARMMNGEMAPPVGDVWGDTTIGATTRCALGPCRNIFTDAHISGDVQDDLAILPVADLLRDLPFAVLIRTGG